MTPVEGKHGRAVPPASPTGGGRWRKDLRRQRPSRSSLQALTGRWRQILAHRISWVGSTNSSHSWVDGGGCETAVPGLMKKRIRKCQEDQAAAQLGLNIERGIPKQNKRLNWTKCRLVENIFERF